MRTSSTHSNMSLPLKTQATTPTAGWSSGQIVPATFSRSSLLVTEDREIVVHAMDMRPKYRRLLSS